MIRIKKNKFTKEDWAVLEFDMAGTLGELHHWCGKQYEYLGTIEPLSVDEHRGNGHRKKMHGMSDWEMIQIIEKWIGLLSEDTFEYFRKKKLLGTEYDNLLPENPLGVSKNIKKASASN
jgi:hypothetical protein